MADPTDTPTEAATPATPRRRGPRKTTAPKAPSTRRRAADKSIVGNAEDAVANAATAATTRVKRGAAKAENAVVSAVKSVTPSADGRRKPAAAKKTAANSGKAKAKGKGKRGGWGVAAVVGGLAATGAAAAALLSLKGSAKSGGAGKPTGTAGGAHQPDGTDASKSFDAKIADENTVPN